MRGRKKYFSYHFKRVLVAHLIIIAFFFTWWGISILFNKIKKKPPMVIPVNFVIDSAQESAKPDDVVMITQVEETQKMPTPKETYKPEIKVSQKKVVRGEEKPKVQPKVLTAEELKKKLSNDSNATSYTLSDEQKNMVRIKNALHFAWQQPSKEAVGDAHVTLEITFNSNGNIINQKLIRSSGNKILDDSVLYGASKVNSIPGLTREFLKRNPKVTILFRVE